MATMTSETTPDSHAEAASLKLRAVLVVLGSLCLWAFFYGNAHTEEFRFAFEKFEPWLWNLYLTCALAGFVGVAGLWWCRRWGFWTLVGAAVVASVVGIYAMGFSLIGAAVVLAIGAVWMAAQPDWKNFR